MNFDKLPKTLTITITEEDLKKAGNYSNIHSCVMSTATKRITGLQVRSGGTFLIIHSGMPLRSREKRYEFPFGFSAQEIYNGKLKLPYKVKLTKRYL